MKRTLILIFLFALAQELYAQNTIRIMSYNVLMFPDALPVNREDTLAKILKSYEVDVLGISELLSKSGSDKILNTSLNTGTTKYKAANFVKATKGYLHQMLYYNSDKLALYSQDTVQSNTRDFNKYILYPITTDLVKGDTVFLDIYVCHLKAGQDSEDSAKRVENVQYLVNHLRKEGDDRNRILMGDLNLYTDQEQAYQLLTQGVNSFFEDPIRLEGRWHNNSIYKSIFTQSTRSRQLYGEGSGGGMDDRFDFILASSSLLNSSNDLFYKTNTYNALGNDGSCFNKNITNCGGDNTLLSSLYYMSDHLPVVAEFELGKTDFINIRETKITHSKVWFSENATLNIELEKASSVLVYNAQGQLLFEVEELEKNHKIDLLSKKPETFYFLLFPETGERIKVALM